MGVEETGLLWKCIRLCCAGAPARFPNREESNGEHLVEETCGKRFYAENALGSPTVAADASARRRQWRCKAACWSQVYASMPLEVLGPQFENRF